MWEARGHGPHPGHCMNRAAVAKEIHSVGFDFESNTKNNLIQTNEGKKTRWFVNIRIEHTRKYAVSILGFCKYTVRGSGAFQFTAFGLLHGINKYNRVSSTWHSIYRTNQTYTFLAFWRRL